MAWCRSTKQRRAMRHRRTVCAAMHFERGHWWLSNVAVWALGLSYSRLRGGGWRGAVICDALVLADDGAERQPENLHSFRACLAEIYRPTPLLDLVTAARDQFLADPS